MRMRRIGIVVASLTLALAPGTVYSQTEDCDLRGVWRSEADNGVPEKILGFGMLVIYDEGSETRFAWATSIPPGQTAIPDIFAGTVDIHEGNVTFNLEGSPLQLLMHFDKDSLGNCHKGVLAYKNTTNSTEWFNLTRIYNPN